MQIQWMLNEESLTFEVLQSSRWKCLKWANHLLTSPLHSNDVKSESHYFSDYIEKLSGWFLEYFIIYDDFVQLLKSSIYAIRKVVCEKNYGITYLYFKTLQRSHFL